MKGKKGLLLAAAVFLAVSTVGVTSAFMFRETSIRSVFWPAAVSCKVHEKLDGGEFTDGIHEGNQKHSIRVENTGKVKAYIRLRAVSYWVDADGTVSGLASEMPELDLKSGWIKGTDHTYYYRTALEPGEVTGILCAPINLKTKVDVSGPMVYQSVDLMAEVIQAEPADAAVDAWGVTLNAQGEIENF